MPRIRQVVSQEPAGILRLPRNIPVATAADLGVGAFQELGKFGGTLHQIAERIQRQEEDVELLNLAAQYDAGLEAVKLELIKNPDFDSHEAAFTKEASQLQRDLLAFTKSNAVGRAFTAHVTRTLPKAVIRVRANALRLKGLHTIAELDRLEDTLSRRVAEAESEDERNAWIQNYLTAVSRAQGRGFLTAPEGVTPGRGVL